MARDRSGARWSTAAMALLTCACWAGPAAAGANLRTAALETDTGATILVLGLSAPVRARIFTLSDPRRVVIDLPNTQRGIALSLPSSAGTVTSMRGGARDGSSFRLVLEVTEDSPAVPRVVSTRTASGSQLRIALGSLASVRAQAVPSIPQRAVRPAHAARPGGPGHRHRHRCRPRWRGSGRIRPRRRTKKTSRSPSRARWRRGSTLEPGMRAVLTRDGDRLRLICASASQQRAQCARRSVRLHSRRFDPRPGRLRRFGLHAFRARRIEPGGRRSWPRRKTRQT